MRQFTRLLLAASCGLLQGCGWFDAIFAPPPPVVVPPPSVETPRSAILQVPMSAQQTQVWCWAATVDMVLRYYGRPVAQCQLVSLATGVNCCVANPICLRPGGLNEMQALLYQVGGVPSRLSGGVLSFAQVQAEIDARRPIILSYSGSFVGHVVVVFGYSTMPERLHIHDPYFGTFVVPYGASFLYNGTMFWSATLRTGTV